MLVNEITRHHPRVVPFVHPNLLRLAALLNLDLEDVVVLHAIKRRLALTHRVAAVLRAVDHLPKGVPLALGLAPAIGERLVSLSDHTRLTVVATGLLERLGAGELVELEATQCPQFDRLVLAQACVVLDLVLGSVALIALRENARDTIRTPSHDVAVIESRNGPHSVGEPDRAHKLPITPHLDRPVLGARHDVPALSDGERIDEAVVPRQRLQAEADRLVE
mmetsp:Transcript_61716/g.151918  ORF Transcript_61716/g.151918 Transcript_61716/m.151918 type:complete len:221 (+) Transcript_61716:1624-2286(+)